MKIRSLSLLLVLAAARQLPGQSSIGPNYSLTPDYRRVVRLDENTISPFHKPAVRALQAAAARVTGPDTSAVIAKFHEIGLTGVIAGSPKIPGLIILGGTIFREGDELRIYDNKTREGAPFVNEHKVILASVTAQAIGLSVLHVGDETPPVPVPIGLLEFYQR